MVSQGRFRADLLYRLQSFSLEMPPLTQRDGDIRELTMDYITRACEDSRLTMKGFAPDFFAVLAAYRWPGNVRELFNSLDSALLAAGEEAVLYPNHLPVHIRTAAIRATMEPSEVPVPELLPTVPGNAQDDRVDLALSYKDYRTRLLEEGEQRYFEHVSAASGGDIKEACRLSGLSKSRFYHFLKKHGLSLSAGPRTTK